MIDNMAYLFSYLTILGIVIWLIGENFRLWKENTECKNLSVHNGVRMILIRSILLKIADYIRKERADCSSSYINFDEIKCYLDNLSTAAEISALFDTPKASAARAGGLGTTFTAEKKPMAGGSGE